MGLYVRIDEAIAIAAENPSFWQVDGDYNDRKIIINHHGISYIVLYSFDERTVYVEDILFGRSGYVQQVGWRN